MEGFGTEEAFKAAKWRFNDEYNYYKLRVLLLYPEMHMEIIINQNLQTEANSENEELVFYMSQAKDNLSENGFMPQLLKILQDIVPLIIMI